MKTKILSILAVMVLAVSMVFAVPVVNDAKPLISENLTNKDQVLRKELSAEIEKEVTKNGGYQNLTIDKTFNVDNVIFEGGHSVYTKIDKKEKDFVFENRYVTSALYNGDEIANIFYEIKDEKIQKIEVVLDKATEDKDVILNVAIKQMPSIENKNEISLYIPNDKTTIAFTENTYKMFVVEDQYGKYNNYVVEEADGVKTIDRNEFFQLYSDNKIKNNSAFVENTVTLQVILILLFAILAILSFLSYILINKDKINNTTEEKKVASKKAPVKNVATTKKTTAATTAKKASATTKKAATTAKKTATTTTKKTATKKTK